MNPKAYYWLDIETTGLDPHDDAILEIAIGRAPFNAPFEITQLANIVIQFEDWTDVDARVKEMHFKNGLMLECMTSKTEIDMGSVTSGAVCVPLVQGADVLSILHNKIVEANPSDWEPTLLAHEIKRPMTSDELPVLAGSSVHFDRAFLKVDLPHFSKLFAHRFLDVSALKLFCRSMGMEKQTKKEAHRAWDDIKESAAHAQECLWWLARNNVADVLDRWHIKANPF